MGSEVFTGTTQKAARTIRPTLERSLTPVSAVKRNSREASHLCLLWKEIQSTQKNVLTIVLIVTKHSAGGVNDKVRWLL